MRLRIALLVGIVTNKYSWRLQRCVAEDNEQEKTHMGFNDDLAAKTLAVLK